VSFTTAKPHVHIRRLSDIPLFAACGRRELLQVVRLGATVDIPAGRILCRQGDIGRECFIVLQGQAVVTIAGRDTTLVECGALIGEIALLTPRGRRTATVTAATDMTLLVFTRSEFTSLVAAAPSMAHRVLREVTRRLVENAETQRARAWRQPST
jgi:CRP/FNR family transcriptional regulator, cyclic AMP receptor protein